MSSSPSLRNGSVDFFERFYSIAAVAAAFLVVFFFHAPFIAFPSGSSPLFLSVSPFFLIHLLNEIPETVASNKKTIPKSNGQIEKSKY